MLIGKKNWSGYVNNRKSQFQSKNLTKDKEDHFIRIRINSVIGHNNPKLLGSQ
jgi:hypothetical protein